MKTKTIKVRSNKSNKFPIYPVRFSPADRRLFKELQNRYGVRSEADAIRLCGRVVMTYPDLSRDDVVYWAGVYQETNPHAQVIIFPPIAKPVP